MAKSTVFREHVATVLGAALGIDFVPGKLDGPQERRAIACTFPIGIEEVSGQVDDEALYIGVRVFKTFRQKRDQKAAIDPGPYEALAELVQTTMRSNQTAGGLWFNRVVAIDLSQIDTAHMVEFTIMGRLENLGLIETAAP